MNTSSKSAGADYSANLTESTTTGTGPGFNPERGGLNSVAFAFASVKVTTESATPAGEGVRVIGADAMTIAQALAGCEQATTPLLAACQVQQDLRVIERSAYKLRARMQGDGKTVSDDSFREAQVSACHAIMLWRSGLTTTRNDGEDVLTAATGERESHVSRVAWRALVAFVSNDGLGSTIQIHGGAEDDWLCAQVLPSESRTERAARIWIERHATTRQDLLSRRLSHVSGGRGKRAQAVEKVGNALALMLGGESLDTAADLAGYKQRGRHISGDGLLRAAKRLGLIGEGFTIPRRGDGKRATRGTDDGGGQSYPAGTRPDGSTLEVQNFVPSAQLLASAGTMEEPASRANSLRAGLQWGQHCGAACLMSAKVRNGKGKRKASALTKASSKRGPLASEGIDVASRPALRAQLRRAVATANRRKLRGVLRAVVS